MKSQGMQENQQVVFMSDGGEDVRQVQEYLHPNGEHIIDWFHITMRLTVLQQQTKALQAERPDEGASSSKQIEKHQAPVVARQRGRGAGSCRQPVHGRGPDQQAIRPGRQVGGGDLGLADLHPEQPGIDPQLRGTVPTGGDDQHGICGVDDQPGGEPPVCEEAADAMDTERSAFAGADADEGPQ
jgi:hypothetical protein